ncbi:MULTISPECIES: hypothetical protein [unclassified Streptomyces]|uniref:hypothetical protein n=1 Tax=unclassified Streptomyces TaxID=2593676 RepID=UPI000DC3E658|nr:MULTISPECIES: hypothetical protein [unclassified Streptomyces]MYT73296.1 hypothetical protein [Streptomyces sp. SID8367]RAJ74896.1 hypothetical protein K377_06663 [Streptomyces sp. PsTaAH-137]
MTSPASPVPPPSSASAAQQPPGEESATKPVPPSPIGRWFGVAVAVAALAVIWYGFSTAAMSSGLVGTRGELTISTCDTTYESGSSRSSGSHPSKRVRELVCEGTFRSSGGDVVDRSARLVLDGNQGGGDGDTISEIRKQDYDRGYKPGYEVSVNRSSDGDLYVTSWLSIANCLCLGFLAVIFLGYSFTCIGAGHFPKQGIGPTHSEGTAMVPKWASDTESWLWVIGGIGLVLAIVFRILLMFAGFASLLM